MNISSGSKAALSKDETRKIDLKRLLRLRLPLMLAVFAALAVPGTAAVWKLIPLEYKASADVRFLASTPRVMNSDARENGVPYEKFLNTQIALITGNAVLSQVLEDPQVRACDAVAHNSAPLEFLKAVIKAETGVNSELVTISCKMRDRDTAMLLVDKTLAAYMKYALSEEANTAC